VAHARLGSALPNEKIQEAEELILKAVQLSPEEAKCWHALGQILGEKAFHLYFGDQEQTEVGKLVQVMAQRRLTPQQLASGAQLTKDIFAAYEKAVALAPDQAKLYQRRCAARIWWQGLVPAMVQMTQAGN
jgi:hypothetical protein